MQARRGRRMGAGFGICSGQQGMRIAEGRWGHRRAAVRRITLPAREKAVAREAPKGLGITQGFSRGAGRPPRGLAVAGSLEVEKVLLAIEELRRWEKRREELARG